MTVDKDFQKLCNRIYEAVVGILTPFDNWSAYLFLDDFDGEPELRNKVAVIWFCSLWDSVEAENEILPQIEKEAEALGFDTLAENSRQVQNFCALVSEFISSFSREEQIFLRDLRVQLVHSYFSQRNRDPVSVKYCEAGELKRESISNEEYGEIVRGFYGAGRSLDEALQPIVARMLDTKRYRYYEMLANLQCDSKEIYQTFLEGDTIKVEV